MTRWPLPWEQRSRRSRPPPDTRGERRGRARTPAWRAQTATCASSGRVSWPSAWPPHGAPPHTGAGGGRSELCVRDAPRSRPSPGKVPWVPRGKVKAGVDQHSAVSRGLLPRPAATFSSLHDWTPNTACVLERDPSLPVETLWPPPVLRDGPARTSVRRASPAPAWTSAARGQIRHSRDGRFLRTEIQRGRCSQTKPFVIVTKAVSALELLC